MRRKLYPALLIAALTLLLGLAVACGDDDDDDDDGGTEPTGGEELTLDQYLAEVSEIQEALRRRPMPSGKARKTRSLTQPRPARR